MTKPICQQLQSHFYQRFFDPEQLDAERMVAAQAPTPLQQPHWVHRNEPLLAQLGVSLDDPQLLTVLAGSAAPPPLKPFATVYSGHQFGHWAGQLGDGRALGLGELPYRDTASGSEQWLEVQLKGAGPTPYSRFADGRAVLRSSIREYLCSEAMHGLGIATTRALTLVASATPVQRERSERAAVVCRAARSFLRFGHFEHYHYSGQPERVAALADYLIERHFPQWLTLSEHQRHLNLFSHTVAATATTIAAWQAVGFAHGVLNTDNMSLLGDTLDYGPFGFLDRYQSGLICNHSDSSGRYAFDRQPMIGLWNLNALANAFLSLLPSEALVEQLGSYQQQFEQAYRDNMRAKLGLPTTASDTQVDSLVGEFLRLLESSGADYSRSMRALALLGSTDEPQLAAEIGSSWTTSQWQQWRSDYSELVGSSALRSATRRRAMNAVNAKYILRNYLAEQAIEAAEAGDYQQVERLFKVLQHPYDEQPEHHRLAAVPPAWAERISVSCSS